MFWHELSICVLTLIWSSIFKPKMFSISRKNRWKSYRNGDNQDRYVMCSPRSWTVSKPKPIRMTKSGSSEKNRKLYFASHYFSPFNNHWNVTYPLGNHIKCRNRNGKHHHNHHHRHYPQHQNDSYHLQKTIPETSNSPHLSSLENPDVFRALWNTLFLLHSLSHFPITTPSPLELSSSLDPNICANGCAE